MRVICGHFALYFEYMFRLNGKVEVSLAGPN
jgi:hypothetical protein